MPHTNKVITEEDRAPESILRSGDTVWCRADAHHAAILVDGAAYYGALREALFSARHSIFIVGWDIDSRTRIVGPSGSADDGAPEALGDLLSHLVGRRSDLDIYVLPWDYSLLFMRERELLPMIALGWRTPDRVHVCVDGTAPIASSHHQKLVVIDDSIAFCGGLDLTLRRWDTASHDPKNSARADADGVPYAPYHDLQFVVDGDAARALGELARDRWSAACDTPAKAASSTACPWPDSVTPDFEDCLVGIARTQPTSNVGDQIDEVERLYMKAIAAAERTIYVENQFLNCDAIADALAHRAEENPELEILIVSNQESGSWLEERTMGVGRRRFIATLQASEAADRIHVLRSAVRTEHDLIEVHIHAKLMIVDDRLLRVGSANINKRSMGLDTECDLAIEAEDDEQRRRILDIRDHLIAHHLGTSVENLRTAIARQGSLSAAIADFSDGEHALHPIDPNYPAPLVDEEFEEKIADAADPKTPPAEGAVRAAVEMQEPEKEGSGVPIRLIVAAVVALLLVGLWYATPIADYADVETLEPYFEAIAQSGWAPIAIPAIFVFASMVFFPVTILIALTGITLGPFVGAACSTAGCLISASLSFGLGTMLGENGLQRIMGRKLNRLSKRVANTGVLSVAGLRLLPVAPFTAINMIAGASHIRLMDFIIGTLLGMAPGIVLITALGDRLKAVWRNPTVENVVVVGLIAALWLAIAVGIQYVVSRRRKKSSQSEDAG